MIFFFSCAQTVKQKDSLNQQQTECIKSVRYIKMLSAAEDIYRRDVMHSNNPVLWSSLSIIQKPNAGNLNHNVQIRSAAK